MRRGAGRALVAVALLVAAACGDDDPPSTPATDPPATSEAPAGTGARPGDPIADGFTVVEGVEPIGPALPIGVTGSLGGVDVVDEGWQVRAVVDGDPVAVVEAYLDQAREAGLSVLVPAAGDPVPCGPDDTVSEGSSVVRCWGLAAAGDRDPHLLVSVRRGEAEGLPQSHLELALSKEAQWFSEQPFPDTGTAEPPAPPVEWPALAAEGEPIGADLGGYPEQVRVEPGSLLAGPPVVLSPYLGQSAVLEVTGEPAEVLARYRQQLVGTYGTGNVFDQEPREVDGATLTVVAADEAGGDKVTITLVERPGEPAWITMGSGHD